MKTSQIPFLWNLYYESSYLHYNKSGAISTHEGKDISILVSNIHLNSKLLTTPSTALSSQCSFCPLEWVFSCVGKRELHKVIRISKSNLSWKANIQRDFPDYFTIYIDENQSLLQKVKLGSAIHKHFERSRDEQIISQKLLGLCQCSLIPQASPSHPHQTTGQSVSFHLRYTFNYVNQQRIWKESTGIKTLLPKSKIIKVIHDMRNQFWIITLCLNSSIYLMFSTRLENVWHISVQSCRLDITSLNKWINKLILLS